MVRLSRKRPKIDSKTPSKKHCKKTSQKLILASILASQTLSKSLQNPRKSLRKAMQNGPCFATLWDSPRNRRKATEVVVCKASKWLGIWLGLLDLPLVALIIKVSPSTCKVSRMFLQMRSPSMSQKTISGSPKINKNRAPRASKSIQKAALTQQCFRRRLWTSIFQFFNDFWTPK